VIHDVIVLGLGGVGSAALFHAARRGASALGLEQFHPVHDRGSSHGQTRVIRLAYYEHPDFVPLLRASYRLWAALEADTGQRLFERVGVLQVGPPDGEVVPGVERSAALHGLPLERLHRREVEDLLPGFLVPEGARAVLEHDAGLLHVEACVAAHLDRAAALGARIEASTPVLSWSAVGDGVEVRTATAVHRARRLIVAAGPWSGPLLSSLGLPLTILQKTQCWYPSRDLAYAASAGAPCFLYELPEGVFYGLPWVDERGVKVAEHSRGEPLSAPIAPDATPPARELEAVDAFRKKYLPFLGAPRRETRGCMYTMTPDGLFVVDAHPEHPQVVFAAGLSGHGFKLTPALGELLAERALEGATQHEHRFLGLDRLRPG
jgi:sarcosine oxidase